MVRGQGAVAAIIAFNALSCSFGVKRLPSGWTPDTEPECETSRALPVTDLVMVPVTAVATTFGTSFFIVKAIFDEDCESECATGAISIGVIGGLITLATIVGSGYGFYHTRRCRRAHREHDAWRREHGGGDADSGPSPGE